MGTVIICNANGYKDHNNWDNSPLSINYPQPVESKSATILWSQWRASISVSVPTSWELPQLDHFQPPKIATNEVILQGYESDILILSSRSVWWHPTSQYVDQLDHFWTAETVRSLIISSHLQPAQLELGQRMVSQASSIINCLPRARSVNLSPPSLY